MTTLVWQRGTTVPHRARVLAGAMARMRLRGASNVHLILSATDIFVHRSKAMYHPRYVSGGRNALVVLLGAALLLGSPVGAIANPVRLVCVLTDIEIHKGSQLDRLISAEKRATTIVFDEDLTVLSIEQDGGVQALADVTITETSINGAIDDISVGIDRASGSIVYQSYLADGMRAEFGDCTRTHAPAP